MNATTRTTSLDTPSGISIELRDPSTLDPDLLAGYRTTVRDTIHGHQVENIVHGTTTVLGDPAALAAIWSALIVNVTGIDTYPTALTFIGDPVETLRQLAAGHHPAGWQVPDHGTPGNLYRWLTDRSSAPALLNHLKA